MVQIWWMDSSGNWRRGNVTTNLQPQIQQELENTLKTYQTDRAKATTMDGQLIDIIIR